MNRSGNLGAILVPTDFSPEAVRALDLALALRAPDGEVTLLHVLDTELASRVAKLGIAPHEEALAKMRARSDEEASWLAKEKGGGFDVMVVEGVPFVEILKIASDLDVDMIAMGTRGASTEMKDILFGGTAEKVLRAARCPVLCVP